MLRISIILLIILITAVFASCTNYSDKEVDKPARINPYDSVEMNADQSVSNQPLSLKSEIPQIELKDERKINPKIDALLKVVERAIAEKSIDLLLSVMDTSVISSYGGGMYGHEDFKHVWEDDYQKLWSKLQKVLKLGGTLENDSLYSIPYTANVNGMVMAQDEEIMPYGCGISIRTDTKLYPKIDSKVGEAIEIGRTYCIIQLQDDHYSPVNNFWKVNVLGTEVVGYVKEEDFYVSADYSLAIEKNAEGNWRITAFAPWD